MKIGLVSDDTILRHGGVQRYVLGLYDWLTTQGHDVSIITCGQLTKKEKNGREITSFGNSLDMTFNDSSSSLQLVWGYGEKIKKFLDKEKFDILHFQTTIPGLLSLQILRFSKTCHVVTLHSVVPEGPLVWLGKAFWPLAKKLNTMYHEKIAVSPVAASFFQQFLPRRTTSTIIPPAISIEQFTKDKPNEKPDTDIKNILFVGRLDKRKGVPYLVSAFKIVKDRVPSARLLLVGDGPEKEDIKTQIKKEKIKDVLIISNISDGDLPNYFATAKIFCSPATHGESFGIVLIEAMAAGLPIVAFDNPGYSGVFPSYQRVFLVHNRSVGGLAQALITLLSYPELAEELGRKNELFSERYDWKEVGPQVFKVYEKARENFLKTKARQRLQILPGDWRKIEKRIRSYTSRIIST